ncbi:FAD-binding oxidoreductase [Mesorhizobium sp. M1148]|uniref:NAD(P)/FAD-dependent oxidoreductase n=1 Tax=unclassified Mesorhizobium TaxID=325217 RepID=UPI0003CF2AAA|nr:MULTISPECIES: FAD-binding oxidoreductase [unclassified Mesorhizobium]ESX52411.1 D-amino acid oxidase [Mesorhizobium sp. LSHC426A00]ESX58680.1 D-amino acid oxidase [Mesorhizobium sp. LSHC424B00]ESX76496.1 D-amino acid oxidase [Mesorhizobium sp. LSHC416B00]ESY06411.1 D-amino acid oxidase [Mesorhizobium sp. LNJC399B00]ESZ51190.1 D-amino acid oxidase [Mesorhizobium sp. L2C054A000]
MAASHQVSKVVVVGGGIFGVSSAVHLARLGIETVLVNDGPLAKGASGRSLAWINSARRRSAEYHRLRMIGIDRYRSLSARCPDAAWLRFDGGLTWDADDASNEIADVFAHEKRLGYDAQHLSADAIRLVAPGVCASAVTPQGAIFNPGEGWVDLPSLIEILIAEFVERGGQVVTEAGRATVTVANGRATGVTTTSGISFAANAVLLATGADVPRMVAVAGQRIADGTPIALLVRTKPVDLPLRAVLNTPRVAIRPTPDGALALDSAWSEEEVVVNPDGTYRVKASTIQGLLDEASNVLDGHPKLELESYGVGPKPIPGDGEPVFGQLREIEGYYVAFSHSGATLGLIAGELLATEIATGTEHPLLASFRPSRFSL